MNLVRAPVDLVAESRLPRALKVWAVVLYVAIVFCMAWWWLSGIWRRHVLECAATVASESLRALCVRMGGRNVRLLISDQIDGPVTWGLLRPVIVLPARFVEPSSDVELRWCLAHELSHVERRDAATLLLATLAQLVCFYNPLYWWLHRQMVLCQDFIADARAARETGTLEDYAEFLVQLARRRLQPRVAASLGIVDRKSGLFRRVKMLVETQAALRPKCRPAASLFISVGSMLFLAALSTIKLDAAETAPTVERASSVAKPSYASPAMEAEEGVVKGVLVRASDKTPVAGAHVILRTGTAKYTNTDHDGRFRFEKVPPYPRGYEVWANYENLITPKAPVRQLNAVGTKRVKFEPLYLEMSEGKQTKFVITSQATGKPIAGAIVRFGFPDRRKIEAHDDGIAIVQGLLSEGYDVTIEAAGYARATPQIDLAHSDGISEYKVSLLPGGIVQGIVIDTDGKPVTGADVVYREGNGIGYYGDSFRTDKSGQFGHRFLPLSTSVIVSAQKNGYVSQSQDVVLTPDQQESHIRLTLTPQPKGGSVVGTITDSSGQPIAEAKVANYGRRSDPHSVTTTDAQGAFRLDDLAEGLGNYELAVTAKGFAPQIVTVQPGTAEHPGSVNVKLKGGHAVRGRVVNEKGEPMKQAVVYPRSVDYRMQMGEVLRTDDDGRFEFDSLPEDAVFDVNMRSYAALRSIPLKLDGGDPVTVTLEAPASIRGVVTDAKSGETVRQFRVRIDFCRNRLPGDPNASFDYEWTKPGLTFNSKDGRFVVGPLVNRLPVQLTVEAEGYNREVIPRVVAAKADSTDDLRISLKRAEKSESFTLKGSVLDHTGKPARGAQLRLIVSSDQPTGLKDNNFNWVLIKSGQLADKPYCEQFLSCVTDAEGHFEFSSILAGKYLQLAYWGEGVPQGRSLAFDVTQPGKTDTVTVNLPQPATIHGTIDRTKLAEAGSMQLTTDREAWHNYEMKLNADQTAFEFHDLPPGTYTLAVMGKPVRFTEKGNVFSRISPLAHLTLKIQPGENKEVTFTGPDKQP
ncbi:MAG: carboxypeptidase regulatory-like domain-containing protein [Pirellulales bacterium]